MTARLNRVNNAPVFVHLGRSFHNSQFAMKRILEVVPTLGESITEGSIARWEKKEGDSISPDDVVVVIETDKVSVDIKANYKGVITKLLASETVAVGKALYEMESTEEGAQSTSPVASTSSSKTKASVNSNEKQQDDHHAGRSPLIRFVGKRPHVKQEIVQPQQKAATAAAAAIKKAAFSSVSVPSDEWPQPSKPQTGVDFTSLKGGAQYGRPALSQKEIDAIESGGAY